jgi:hypothetical protein
VQENIAITDPGPLPGVHGMQPTLFDPPLGYDNVVVSANLYADGLPGKVIILLDRLLTATAIGCDQQCKVRSCDRARRDLL